MSEDFNERQRLRQAQTCVHFNGLDNKQCDAGVSYESVRDSEAQPYRWPCFTFKACSKLRLPTAEELAAEEQKLAAVFEKLVGAVRDGICPHCNKDAKPLRQVGRCVYGSCGHRMYQGKIPKPKKGGA